MPYEFEVKVPEEQLELASSAQLLVAHTKNGQVKVVIRFMYRSVIY
jgi:hypothetical protein